MDNTIINNGASLAKGESIHPAQKALKLIWIIGILCFAVILLFFFKPLLISNSSGGYYLSQIENQNKDFTSIDQLLLSSDESSLADKKSFVNGALRFQWRNQEPDLNEGNNRIILYDNILKKKLQKIPKVDDGGFSVKPVPR